MFRICTLLLTALVVVPHFSNAQCSDDELPLEVVVLLDDYPYETTWRVLDVDGDVLLEGSGYTTGMQGDTVSATTCVGPEACLTFEIEDSFGDGICCGFGEGGFWVYLDGALVGSGGEFSDFASFDFNCPPGSSCGSALSVDGAADFYDTGAEFANTWYEFVPDSTGIYHIGTHFDENACDNALWIYDYCVGLDWSNGYQGALFFNDDKDSVSQLAAIETFLAAGTTYWIRVGSWAGQCDGQSIRWNIDYDGPISGCTDPESCNYNPLAVVDDGSCLMWGDPACPEGPDLVAIEADFVNSLYIDYLENADGCMVNEGCLAGYGTRELLRFDTRIENIGTVDFYIGTPPPTPADANDQWEWDDCHGHWHYEGYAEYVAYTEDGTALPIGFKNGFCVMDLDCSMNGGTPTYNCGNQGISAQCGDIYGAYLDCQWFDITDLPAGQYTFAMKVNWDQSPDALGRQESDYLNNWTQVCLQLMRDPVTNLASFTVIDDCQPYTDCEGTLYGDAQPDCAGDCAGTRVTGDLNQDTLRDLIDLDMYLDAALYPNDAPTECTDLNGDGAYSVTDAALLIECLLHEGAPNLPGHTHKPCEFPYGLVNTADTVFLSIGGVLTDTQTGGAQATLLLENPTAAVRALQFRFGDLGGAKIDYVAPQVADFSAEWRFSDDELVVVSPQEDFMAKSNEPVVIAVVYFDAPLTMDELCLDEIRASVNLVRDETIAVIGECGDVQPILSSTDLDHTLRARMVPNPVRDVATLRLDRPTTEPLVLLVFDPLGREVLRTPVSAGQSLQFSTADWTVGTYAYQIRGATGFWSGMFVKGAR